VGHIDSKKKVNASRLPAAVLGLIGVVTLAVGGVGVMNIIWGSVTERTEKSDCASGRSSPRHILVQFFARKALVLTFFGGVIGILVAVFLTGAIPPMPLYSEF